MAGEAKVVWMPGGVRTEIRLTGADTGGAFCLLLDEPPTGWSLPAHVHLDAAETIHVLAGEFETTVDGITERSGPGHTVHIPAGVVHSGGNVGAGPGDGSSSSVQPGWRSSSARRAPLRRRRRSIAAWRSNRRSATVGGSSTEPAPNPGATDAKSVFDPHRGGSLEPSLQPNQEEGLRWPTRSKAHVSVAG